MSHDLGSQDLPLRVAIVGSGPAGCFTAEELLKSNINVVIDIFDRLGTPFGLVRSGVAPDHQKIKKVIDKFAKLFENESVSFWGNVEIGKDITIEKLQDYYDCIVLAHGAENDRKLKIPGSNLNNCHSATEFVGWYNAHPDYYDRNFKLTAKNVAIIGQGNVAIDVARILAKTNSELHDSDIASYALSALETSQVENIYLIGRRGPVQAAFTDKELRELGELEDCSVVISPADLELAEACKKEITDNPRSKAARNFKTLESLAALPERVTSKKIHLMFFSSPIELCGQDSLSEVRFEKNQLTGASGMQKAVGTGQYFHLNVDLLFTSIGYFGAGIPGVPFDEQRGTYPNQAGKVLNHNDPVNGIYTAGWIKRGPSGVIGTNKSDAAETVKSLLADLEILKTCSLRNTTNLVDHLKQTGVKVIDFNDWLKIDALELKNGQKQGKLREKFSTIEEIHAALS